MYTEVINNNDFLIISKYELEQNKRTYQERMTEAQELLRIEKEKPESKQRTLNIVMYTEAEKKALGFYEAFIGLLYNFNEERKLIK